MHLFILMQFISISGSVAVLICIRIIVSLTGSLMLRADCLVILLFFAAIRAMCSRFISTCLFSMVSYLLLVQVSALFSIHSSHYMTAFMLIMIALLFELLHSLKSSIASSYLLYPILPNLIHRYLGSLK